MDIYLDPHNFWISKYTWNIGRLLQSIISLIFPVSFDKSLIRIGSSTWSENLLIGLNLLKHIKVWLRTTIMIKMQSRIFRWNNIWPERDNTLINVFTNKVVIQQCNKMKNIKEIKIDLDFKNISIECYE